MSALTSRDYAQAVQSQNACNLVALVNSLRDVLVRIREDNPSSDVIAHHPIVRLYVEQLSFLSGSYDQESYANAYEICLKKSEIDDPTAGE